MKNKNAQALIEFVLILPILIILLFSIIDFGNIFVTKSTLENKATLAYETLISTTDITSIEEKVEATVKKDDKKVAVDLSFNDSEELVTIKLKKEIKTITPGLNLIIGYPYVVSVERVAKYVRQ